MEERQATADDAPYLSRENILELSDAPSLVFAPFEDTDGPGGVEDTDGPAPPPIEAGYVYILMEMKDGHATGYYQVGSTTDVKRRQSELQAGNARPLEYTRYDVVRDMRKAKNAVLSALDRYSVNLGGGPDWFFANTTRVDSFYLTFMQEATRFQ